MTDISELTKQLENKDSIIRRGVVEKLGSIEHESAIDALILALKDKDRFVRQEAVLALKKIGGSRAIEQLTLALKTEKNQLVLDFINSTLERLRNKESESK